MSHSPQSRTRWKRRSPRADGASRRERRLGGRRRSTRRRLPRGGGAKRRSLLGGRGDRPLGRYPFPVEIGNLEKVLRVGEGRRLKRLQEQAAYVTSLEPEFEQLSAADLQGKTAVFRQRLENGESLDDLTFEAFAAVREARRRASDQRMFDVQLMGGIVLHEGDIAEMKTGEGKTFVASLALYLNGLAGRGTHLVTVNDYLAQRDAEWNRPVSESLGMG